MSIFRYINSFESIFNISKGLPKLDSDYKKELLEIPEIIEKIKSSEFLFADLTGARPSVYYEVGFAHAISKRVILYRRVGEKIHFDLAGYNCPEYTNLSDLEKKVIKRLAHMTGRKIDKS